MPHCVVYTDLDGTLLDHDSYSWAPAADMLHALRARGVPVVPTTSKTRAELETLRAELGSEDPCIVENGAAVLIPTQSSLPGIGALPRVGEFRVQSFVAPRATWLDLIERAYAAVGQVAKGFSQMTVDEIVALTGLSPEAATRAAAREYGEPLHWLVEGADREAFIAFIRSHGGVVLQGGRFAHVSGASDKGRALQWLHARYAEQWGDRPVSIAAGDSHNDIAMLEAADWALVVRSPAHEPPVLGRDSRTRFSEAYGPTGWAQGLEHILAELGE